MIIRETTVTLYRPVIRITPPADMPRNEAEGVIRGLFWLLQNDYHEIMSDYYYSDEYQAFCLEGGVVGDNEEAEEQGAYLIPLIGELITSNWFVS